MLMEEIAELQGRIETLRTSGQDVTLLTLELESKRQTLSEAFQALNKSKLLKG
jgi:hypothetical protein